MRRLSLDLEPSCSRRAPERSSPAFTSADRISWCFCVDEDQRQNSAQGQALRSAPCEPADNRRFRVRAGTPHPRQPSTPGTIQDLRFAVRTFTKTPGFTLLAILVLGIGIGANSAMFTVVNALMFTPLSGNAGELMGVFSRDRTRPDEYRAFSYPNYADIRSQTRDVFDGLMAHTFAIVGVTAGDTTKRAFASVVSSNYFETLGVTLAARSPRPRPIPDSATTVCCS